MKRHLFLLQGLLVAGTLYAADANGPRLESPVLGYVFDSSANQIRAISGIPGAAALGESVALPVALTDAVVHSGSRAAVVLTKEGRMGLAWWSGAGRIVELETSLAALGGAAFSRSGKWLAIRDEAAVEVWSVAQSPALLGRWSVSVDAMDVSDAGTVLAVQGGSIVRLEGDQVQVVAGGGGWSALAYEASGDAIAADTDRNELLRITPEGGRSVIAALPGRASVIAVASDGTLFAAAPAWGVMAIAGSTVTDAASCDCRPEGLDRLAGGAVHVRGTAWVVDSQEGLRLTALPSLFALGAHQQ